MNKTDKTLQIITDETKTSVSGMKVVTPSIYASIFSKFSKDYNTVLEDEIQFSHDLLSQHCSTFLDIQKTTSKNVQNLSDNTEKALTAIEDKDESALNEVLQETRALRREIEALKAAVYKDELTSIYNRKWLHDQIVDSQTGLFLTSGILAMIDLNYFKIVNDTFGHVIGDKVLIIIANELKKSTYDVIRYGGDEFIVIFPQDVNEHEAFKVLDDIRERVLKKKLKAQDIMFRTSFSIGLSPYSTKDELNLILEAADKNMYEDKLIIKKRIPGINV